MHELEKKLFELGVIDNNIESIVIDDWFENAEIAFSGNGEDIIKCKFNNCFEVSLRHDKTYNKGKKNNSSLDYKYFVQDIEIMEENRFYIIQISAWPLDGKIVCTNIEII